MKVTISIMNAFEAFKEVLEDSPVIIKGQFLVSHQDWRKAYMRLAGISKWGETQRRAFYRARHALIDIGVVKQPYKDGFSLNIEKPDLQRL